jgi:hypothetical protein
MHVHTQHIMLQQNTNVRNVLFIAMHKGASQSAAAVCTAALHQLRTTGRRVSRHVQRVLPVDRTCAAKPDALQETLVDVVSRCVHALTHTSVITHVSQAFQCRRRRR